MHKQTHHFFDYYSCVTECSNTSSYTPGGQGIERKKEFFVRNIFRGTFKGGYGNLNRKNKILKIEILINLEIF